MESCILRTCADRKSYYCSFFPCSVWALQSAPGISLKGFFSFLVWRSAYLTRLISWRNRLYVMVNWATTMVFGRDVSKI